MITARPQQVKAVSYKQLLNGKKIIIKGFNH